MYIGVDVGGMSVKAGIVDESGKILFKHVVDTGADRTMPEIVHDMATMINDTVKLSGIPVSEISSIGMGIPGVSDQKTGKIVYCTNINLDNAPIADEIHKYLDLPVYLDNDANVAALAEYYALGGDMPCFVAVTLGTGVGGGVILDGKIFSGFNGIGAELGHIIINENGKECGCGAHGCWEAYASVTALISQTKEAMMSDKNSLMHQIVAGDLNAVNGKTAFDAAKQGDKTAQAVVETYLNHVGVGLASLINVFQPNIIAIGGAISKEGDYLLNPLKEYCSKNAYGTAFAPKTQLKIASLGNDAGIIGAAMLGKSIGVIR